VAEMLARVSASELTEWAAYIGVEDENPRPSAVYIVEHKTEGRR
jgi:hypothetical protein